MNGFDPRRILPSNWRKLTGLPPDVPLAQPFLRVYLNSSQTFSASVTTKISYDTVDVDTKGWWDATNKRYVPQIPGRYQVSGSVNCSFGSVSAGGYVLEIDVRKNGASVHKMPTTAGVAESTGTSRAYAFTSELQMNGTTDYIDMAGYCEGSAPAFGGNAGMWNMLEIHYLGP